MDETQPLTDTHGVPIRGRVVLELTDARRATFELPEAKKMLLRAGSITVCAGAFLAINASMTGGLSPIAMVPIAATVLVVGGVYWGLRRGAARIVEDKTDAARDVRYEFGRTGYSIVTPVTTVRAEWASLHHVHEGLSTFFLYTASNAYQLVPKRAFRPEDIPRIRDLLRAHVTPRAAKSSAARVVVLWIALVVAFLAVWQFLDSTPRENRGRDEPVAPSAP